MISGNKGEWSELYVFLRLLADGKLYAADSDLHRIENVYSPVKAVFRQEMDTGRMEYRLGDKKSEVTIYWNGDKIKSVASERLAKYASMFYEGILSGKSSSFPIDGAETIMDDLKVSKIKAP